ncbi:MULTISPECIES: amino acid ABC transporter permease [unclassified Arthrobacter]|uniref:amino acid ABC transporter permease n=1 Tax=unclassified Arthrobacter TaxID=235627 RepID=UPI001D140140|nr:MULTISPECIES: amino acid ABC transporter permease [unclassified Arthrobacter]MCC3290153.1 amino acid ABC transporter permease [Arthrobacter sp. zg-Y1110]MCC3300336.1 amino acid ABC transporter permease [Arthrobacter sp. zg-Y895]MCQ1945717.1 amino acid ABC transporter permease [Arthrobacter sp. zg-Y1116]MCQ1994624.1 amino acid ABC transporter permease [Arthrobacter sp. zg-Y1171]UWX81297.1 amino acid ABC transporter permease [Arthrobacter sp. zg-Y1171]
MKPSTRRRLFRGVLYAVFVIALVAVVLAADWEAIGENFFDAEVAREAFPTIITVAVKNTIIYTVIAFAGGLLLGLLLALMKLSPVAPYRWAATAYIELFRGLPALLVIFGFAFAVPIAFDWRPPGGSAGAGLLALIIVSGAYIAETIRAGIQAVPSGQAEAARSLGMGPTWTMISVTLPQAFRIITPPLTNELVILIKDTSLLFIAGMALQDRELTTFARDSVSQTANATPLVLAALMYLIITLPLTQLVAKLERHNQRGR